MFSQVNKDSLKQFKSSINEIYGINEVLVNGYPYKKTDHRVKGHPFLMNDSWNDATIFLKNRKVEGKKIKYDIHNDVIILKSRLGRNNFKLVQLNKFLVDSFRLNSSINRHFVKSSIYQKDKEETVFYEKIYNYKGTAFVRKLGKKLKKSVSAYSSQGEFSQTYDSRYMIKNDIIKKVNNKSAFIKYFPKEKRKHIRKYFRDKDLNYSQANIDELKKLSNYCFKKLNEKD
ncbi:MAG: hypothetical protein ACQESN_09755 [Thermotogota bacterium]